MTGREPVVLPPVPLVVAEPVDAFAPTGGFFEGSDGDGDEDDGVPFVPVWIPEPVGRFNLFGGWICPETAAGAMTNSRQRLRRYALEMICVGLL